MPFGDTPANKQRLMSEFGYSERGADLISRRLSAIEPTLSAAVDQWWDSAAPIEISVEGKTITQLKAEHGLNDIAAILTLNWLINDPRAALRALARGHDYVL